MLLLFIILAIIVIIVIPNIRVVPQAKAYVIEKKLLLIREVKYLE